MNHTTIRRQLEMYLLDELSSEQRREFERHLDGCPDCSAELAQLKKFEDTVRIHRRPVAVDDRLLQEARQQLRAALRVERSRPSLPARVRNYLDWVPAWNYRTALGGVTMLAAGILIGRTFLAPSHPLISAQPMVEPIAVGYSHAGEEPRIMNLQIQQTDGGTGEVEFSFDAVTPVQMKGNINDERIQAVLAHALVTEQNPGIRLRSVNMLSSRTEVLNPPDPTVKKALVTAAKSDDNPAVRREALRALKSFPFDDEIREAFLYVLVQDTNPGLRIAAINNLDSARVQNSDPGPDLLRVLQERMQTDNNNYVRIRAKAVLKEATRQ